MEKDGEVLLEVPCLKIETVLLFGNVQFTTQAAAELLEHGIEMALLTTRGRLRGQLTPPKAKNVYLRVAQYDLHRDQDFCLAFSREVVAAKIESTAAVLRRYRRNHPEAVPQEEIAVLDERAAATGPVQRPRLLRLCAGGRRAPGPP